ncbi:MAG: hypothetical protein M3347_14335 [Armatimonadota bacterium]|nr:hypothetical protein [Armatimonadota bacterium]
MKHKNRKWPLLIALVGAIFLAGCSGSSGPVQVVANPFTGRYSGTFTQGILTFTVDNQGRITATVTQGATTLNATGTVDSGGQITIRTTGGGFSDIFTGTLSFQGGRIVGSGTYTSCPVCFPPDPCPGAPCLIGTWSTQQI